MTRNELFIMNAERCRKRLTFAIFIFAVGIIQPAFGQDFRLEFKGFFDQRDFPQQEKVLKRWENATPNDPELFVSYFNYYFAKSRQEVVSLTRTQPTGTSIPLTKTDDPNVVAYLGGNVTFTRTDFDAGIAYIDRGITKFPDRLDMRFGKTYALGQIKDYRRFTDEIVNTVDRSNTNRNAWIWRDGKPVEKPQQFMLGSIQDYVVQLLDAGDEEANFIKPIAETILKYYPDHVESLSNLSVYHMMRGDFDAALEPLLKAEKLAPNDYIVIGNIAYSYYKKRDKLNATKYYTKLSAIGDERAKADATAKLKEISSWK